MPKQKKQHYVPRFYMKRFSRDGKKFSLMILETRKIMTAVPFSSQCQQDYFYGADLAYESVLSSKEAQWADVFSLIEENKHLGDAETQKIREFVLYQYFRTDADYQHMLQWHTDLMMMKIFHKVGAPPSHEIYDKARQKVTSMIAEKVSPCMTLDIVRDGVEKIRDLKVLIINYDTSIELIASDVPVIAINAFNQLDLGCTCLGIMFLLPFSPRKLVVVYDAKIYPKYKDVTYITLKNSEEVKALNALQLASADTILYSHRDDELMNFHEQDWKMREKSRSLRASNVVGNLILALPRRCLTDYSFSFAKLHPKFAEIPQKCRDSMSREKNKDFAAKLKWIPQAFEAARQKCGYKLGMSKREYQRGVRKFRDAMRLYWNDKL